MVLCGQVYCSNCILRFVLVEVRVHTSIRNNKDFKSSGKTYSYQAVVDRGAQQLCHILTKGRRCSLTPCKYKHKCYHTNCLGAHPGYQCPRLASAGSRPSSERENSQANQKSLPSNTVVILSNDATETGESIKYSSKIGKYYLKTVK